MAIQYLVVVYPVPVGTDAGVACREGDIAVPATGDHPGRQTCHRGTAVDWSSAVTL